MPRLWLPAIALCAIIPMGFMLWASRPFVISAHLRHVPFKARRSVDDLFRWTQKLPYGSELDLTTFTWYGFFQRTTVPLVQLRKKKPGIRNDNFMKLNAPEYKPWLFYVGNERNEGTRTRLWRQIVAQVEPLKACKKT